MSEYTAKYFCEVEEIIDCIEDKPIDEMIRILSETKRNGGRLFILGVGGSAANASHAVNDFRKVCGIESYTPTDNIAELTARTNDDGWWTVFSEWLKVSKLSRKDTVLVFSVSGGSEKVSANIISALKFAKRKHAHIIGIVGRDGGYTAKVADACVIIPTVNPKHVTPHTESFQAVIWHLIVEALR
jgi:D-sedoheptulose 7-phosphate isomerase